MQGTIDLSLLTTQTKRQRYDAAVTRQPIPTPLRIYRWAAHHPTVATATEATRPAAAAAAVVWVVVVEA